MEQSIGRGEGIHGREVRDMRVLTCICICLCSYECVCVSVCVLGEVSPSLLCLYAVDIQVWFLGPTSKVSCANHGVVHPSLAPPPSKDVISAEIFVFQKSVRVHKMYVKIA